MSTVLYANGEIPLSVMDPVPAALGGDAYLLPLVAESFHRCRVGAKAIGFDLRVTSAGDGFRSKQRQVNVFLERYDRNDNPAYRGPYGDVRRWEGRRYVRMRGAAAAVPGTSNHGKGITVDVAHMPGYGTKGFNRLAPVLAAEGWSNAEGASIGEPWHWNYTRTAYRVDDTNRIPDIDIEDPGGDLPDPLKPKDWLMALTDDQQKDFYGKVLDLHQQLLSAEIPSIAKRIQGLQEGQNTVLDAVKEVPAQSAQAVWRGTHIDHRVGDGVQSIETLQELADVNTRLIALTDQVAALQRALVPVEQVDQQTEGTISHG